MEKRTISQAQIKDLWKYILQKADVVVSTVNNAEDNILHEHFCPDIVIIDEAA